MKQLFFIILALALALPATGQRVIKKEFSVDTLSTSATADTLTFDLARTIGDLYHHAWQVSATNVSGTSNATAYLQTSVCATCDHWVTIDSLTITGTTADLFTGTFYGLRQRVYVLAPSSTQSTALNVYAILKRIE